MAGEGSGCSERWLIVFRRDGIEMRRLDAGRPSIPGDAVSHVIIEGRIVEASFKGQPLPGETLEGANAGTVTGRGEAPGHGAGAGGLIPVVLDQMYRGVADILAGKLDYVEAHEVVGRGLQSTLAKSGRVYLEPAESDYDVIKLAERLARKRGLSVLVTGDKKLAEQARLKPGVRVLYMPPGEYPGKESMVEALIGEIERVRREATRQDKNPRAGPS